jgi:hypothetical protein
MRGHMVCGGLSRSRRLSASSRLRAKLSVLPCVGIWNLIDRLTCVGLAEGPLVWLSICACVEMVAKTEMRMMVVGK